jgi:hypothetical protein
VKENSNEKKIKKRKLEKGGEEIDEDDEYLNMVDFRAVDAERKLFDLFGFDIFLGMI